MRVYFGDNWGEYLGIFDAIVKKPGLPASWSWAAFFVPWIWLVYRKRFVWAFGMFVVMVATNHFLHGISRLAAAVGIAILIGLYGKALYVRHAMRVVDAILAKTEDQHQRIAIIRAKGGVSDRGILIVVSALLLLFVIAFVILPLARL